MLFEEVSVAITGRKLKSENNQSRKYHRNIAKKEESENIFIA